MHLQNIRSVKSIMTLFNFVYVIVNISILVKGRLSIQAYGAVLDKRKYSHFIRFEAAENSLSSFARSRHWWKLWHYAIGLVNI